MFLNDIFSFGISVKILGYEVNIAVGLILSKFFNTFFSLIKSEILNQNFRFLFTKGCYNISIVNNITSIIILYFQYLSY